MNFRRPVGWSIVVGAMLVAIGVLAWQRQVLAMNQAQVAGLRSAAINLARLQTENAQLKQAQPTAAELEKLHADVTAMERFRLEIADLKTNPTSVVPQASALSPSPTPIPASAWRNAGTATPAAAVETALWAAAGGDIDALAATLGFAPKTRAALERAIASLPENLRVQYGSPERMVAFFTVKDVPLGDMQILQERSNGDGEREVTVRLRAAEDQSFEKEVTLSLQRLDDSWRLIVPPKPVQSYFDVIGAALHAAAQKDGGIAPKAEPAR